MIRKTALFGLFFALSACATQTPLVETKNYERVYRSTFEEVWRAVQQAIIAYPLKVNNMDVGQIQTTPIRGNAQYKAPAPLASSSGGHRYTLTINVIKESPKVTKVTIVKDMVVHRDFISRPENLISEGYEENVLLYRVGREIDIEKALLRSARK